MSESKSTESNKLHIEVVKQMLTLATAGFGLVAALAWNSLIQTLVVDYIKRWLPTNGKLTSLILYALIVTLLAVFITYQLSKILRRFEAKEEKK